MKNAPIGAEETLRNAWRTFQPPLAPELDVPDEFGYFVQLAIATLARPSTLAQAKVRDIDVKRKVWLIQEGKSSPRLLPLSPLATTLFKDAIERRKNRKIVALSWEANADEIFRGQSQMSAANLSFLMTRRFAKVARQMSWPNHRLYDLRRSGYALMEEVGLSRNVMGHVLNLPDLHAAHLDDIETRRAAVIRWEELLMRVVESE